MNGLLLFTQYALAPNQHQFCGPAKSKEIADYLAASVADAGLRELLGQFEGACPYLQFIAAENRIADSFDEKVVEAYWLGNELLNNIRMSKMAAMFEDRFKHRAGPDEMRWLLSKIPAGAKPHHSLHVFDIYSRIGGVRGGGDLGPVMQVIDECRIGWGKIVAIRNSRQNLLFESLDKLGINSVENYLLHRSVANASFESKDNFPQVEVAYKPIILQNQKLVFSSPQSKNLFNPLNHLVLKPGDWVSFHWSQVCDKLSVRQLKNLVFWTNHHCRLANLTM